MSIKPTLKNLALHEAYSVSKGTPSNMRSIYTKTINIVPKLGELPKDVDNRVRIVFNSAKNAGELLKDTELQDAYR